MQTGKRDMRNILVTMPEGGVRDTFMPPGIAEEINKLGSVEWNTSVNQYTSEELREKLKGKDICITGWGCAAFDENVLANADRLKLIAHTGGTVATLTSEAIYRKGIRIVSANDCFAESVAEGVIAYILAALRDIPYWDGVMRTGGWKPLLYINEGIMERTVGLVGFGAISKILVGMLKPFRVGIKVYSNHLDNKEAERYGVKSASLEEIFSTCNIISLHAAQRPETYHMVNERLLQMIPEGALLVNTARGSIIDEEALIKELEKGRFKAVLDVYTSEPLSVDSPLRNLKNAILMPHMGGPTVDRRVYCTKMILEEMYRFMNGRELEHEISSSYASHMTR